VTHCAQSANRQQEQGRFQQAARQAQTFFRSPVPAVSPSDANLRPGIWPESRFPPDSIRYPEFGTASSDAVEKWPFEGGFRREGGMQKESGTRSCFLPAIYGNLRGDFRRFWRSCRNLSADFQHTNCKALHVFGIRMHQTRFPPVAEGRAPLLWSKCSSRMWRLDRATGARRIGNYLEAATCRRAPTLRLAVNRPSDASEFGGLGALAANFAHLPPA